MKKKLFFAIIALFAVVITINAQAKKESATYDLGIPGYTFENEWILSHNEGNFPADGFGVHTGTSADQPTARGMAVKDGLIYFSARKKDTSDASVLIYDGATGAFLKEISLPDSIFTMPDPGSETGFKSVGYPANDIQVDMAGNIIMSNMPLNIFKTNYLQVWILDFDVEAGTVTEATKVLEYSDNNPAYDKTAARLDYIGVYGDLKNNGYIMSSVGGVVAGIGNTVLRWDIVDGKANDWYEQITIKEYVPATATGNDTGSRVTPMRSDETQFYLDGQASFASLYDNKGNYIDGFKGVTSDFITNMTPGNNGVDEFMIGDKTFMVFSYRNTTGTPCSSFALAEVDLVGGTPIKPLAVFPEQGMGTPTNSNAVRTALPRIEVNGDVATIYVYGFNNGLARYKFKVTGTGVKEVGESHVRVLDIKGNEINLSEVVKSIEVYSLTGQKVVSTTMKKSITVPANQGIYILKLEDATGAEKVQKIILN